MKQTHSMKSGWLFTQELQARSDEQLMQAIAARVELALQEIHRRHQGLLKSVIVGVLHDETEAEDVLQEVFLQIWNRAESYLEEKGKALSWIVTMARRRAIDRIRQRKAYSSATDRFEKEYVAPKGSATSWTGLEHGIDRSDIKNYLDQLMNHLHEAQREVISLAYYYGMSQRQIAAHCDLPLGTVKTRLELGMKKLACAAGPARKVL